MENEMDVKNQPKASTSKKVPKPNENGNNSGDASNSVSDGEGATTSGDQEVDYFDEEDDEAFDHSDEGKIVSCDHMRNIHQYF